MDDLFTFRHTATQTHTRPTTTAAIFLRCYLECIFFWQQKVFNLTRLNPGLQHLARGHRCRCLCSADVCVVGRGCCPPQHLLISSDFKSWLFLAPGLITVPFFPCLPPGQLACGRIRLPGCLEGCGICYRRRFNICQIFNSGLRCGFMDRVILCVSAVQVHKTILQAGPFPFSVKAG